MLKTDSILHIVHFTALDFHSTFAKLPSKISHILQHFADFFQEPQGLPPSRPGDHQIPLVPGATFQA